MNPRRISPAELGLVYMDVHHRLHRTVDEAMSQTGLSLARTKVLNQLADGAVKQAEIAARLGLAARSVTDTVDSLERDGLAERRADPTDRRAWLVELTAEGKTALDAAMAVRAQTMNQTFGALDAEQRAQLESLLLALRATVIEPGERDA